MNTNNPLTEIGAIALAVLLIIAAALLDYAGKIDFTAVTFMVTLAAGIFAGNLALKAPSPAQQAQIGALAQQQQTLTSQVLSALPQVVSATQAPPAPQPVVQPTPQAMQAFQTGDTFEHPIVTTP